MNPVINKIYVSTNDTVTVIDGATNTVIATVPAGPNPGLVALNPATNKIYVTNCCLGTVTVTVIDGTTDAVIA